MRSNIGGTGPASPADPRAQPRRQHARQILHDAAAGDVGDGLDPVPRGQGADQRGVDAGGLQQLVGQGTSQVRHAGLQSELRGFQQDLPRQRIAVAVEPAGRQADDHVAGAHRAGIGYAVLLDDADGEACEIVLSVPVQGRHLRGLAAQQRAAGLAAAFRDSAHHRPEGGGFQLAGGEVVEEEQRLRRLGDDVVDAHGHEVDAHGVMAVRQEGDLELGADPVGGGHQHRPPAADAGQVEESAEPADASHEAGPGGLAGHG